MYLPMLIDSPLCPINYILINPVDGLVRGGGGGGLTSVYVNSENLGQFFPGVENTLFIKEI